MPVGTSEYVHLLEVLGVNPPHCGLSSLSEPTYWLFTCYQAVLVVWIGVGASPHVFTR